MTRIRAFVTAGLLMAMAAPLSAQARGAARAGMGPGHGGMMPAPTLARQVEAALQRQEELALDADRVAGLEEIRSELDRMAAERRAAREALRQEVRERPESVEERREWRREQIDRQRAERARADTAIAALQSRFETLVSPLERRELQRTYRMERMERLARPAMRGARRGPVMGVRPWMPRMERDSRQPWVRLPQRSDRWRR